MKVMGSNYLDAGLAENLVNDIALEHITTQLGGTAQYLPFDTYFGKPVNIGRKATETLEFEVQEAGAIRWTVTVEAGTEILFSAKFVADCGPDGAQAQLVVLAPTTYTADAGRMSGEWVAAGKGTICFVFDNSAAWIKSRTVEIYTELPGNNSRRRGR